MSRKLWLSLRRLLQVHKSGDCGSPRVVGSTRERRSSMRLASIALIGLRPPPNRRTRSASTAPPARNSLSARPTVLRASPVARDTAAIPPCPAVIASAAANRRRPRSSSTGSSASNRWRMVDSSITPPYYRQLPDEGILPPRNFRVEEIQLFADDALGVAQDYAQAVKWYRKAADQGNVEAQIPLATSYSFGWGVPQDSAQALMWYRRAADQDDIRAEIFLATAY